MLQFRQTFRGYLDGKEHSSFCLVETRFNHKFEKVYIGLDPKNKNFGDDCGFDEFIDFTTEKKFRKQRNNENSFGKDSAD